MPIYDFICRACGHNFETLVMGKAKPRCPKCQSDDLAKQMSVCAHRTAGAGAAGASAGSKCGGCSGGSCTTCH